MTHQHVWIGVTVRALVLALLVSLYLVNPLIGWVAMGVVTVFAATRVFKRGNRGQLSRA